MYVNGEYRGDNPLGKLLHDFSTSNADEMYYKEFADKMRFYKQDEEGVKMASKIIEEYGDIRAAEALKQGIQQGAHQKAIEDAKKLLADGKYTAQEISELLNIPVEAFADSK